MPLRTSRIDDRLPSEMTISQSMRIVFTIYKLGPLQIPTTTTCAAGLSMRPSHNARRRHHGLTILAADIRWKWLVCAARTAERPRLVKAQHAEVGRCPFEVAVTPAKQRTARDDGIGIAVQRAAHFLLAPEVSSRIGVSGRSAPRSAWMHYPMSKAIKRAFC